MTNFERIKNMNKDELAKFLDDLTSGGIEKAPHSIWFNEKYCKVCPDIEVIYLGKKDLWKECDFESKCPNTNWDSGMIKLWLDGEYEKI